ncbi:hypothetical protein CaCOL14_006785 [Colletotrichum acutatum]
MDLRKTSRLASHRLKNFSHAISVMFESPARFSVLHEIPNHPSRRRTFTAEINQTRMTDYGIARALLYATMIVIAATSEK